MADTKIFKTLILLIILNYPIALCNPTHDEINISKDPSVTRRLSKKSFGDRILGLPLEIQGMISAYINLQEMCSIYYTEPRYEPLLRANPALFLNILRYVNSIEGLYARTMNPPNIIFIVLDMLNLNSDPRMDAVEEYSNFSALVKIASPKNIKALKKYAALLGKIKRKTENSLEEFELLRQAMTLKLLEKDVVKQFCMDVIKHHFDNFEGDSYGRKPYMPVREMKSLLDSVLSDYKPRKFIQERSLLYAATGDIEKYKALYGKSAKNPRSIRYDFLAAMYYDQHKITQHIIDNLDNAQMINELYSVVCHLSEEEVFAQLYSRADIKDIIKQNVLANSLSKVRSPYICNAIISHLVRIPPLYDPDKYFLDSLEYGHVALIRLLLEDGRFTPNTPTATKKPLERIVYSNLELQTLILEDPRTDPSINRNAAIILAIEVKRYLYASVLCCHEKFVLDHLEDKKDVVKVALTERRKILLAKHGSIYEIRKRLGELKIQIFETDQPHLIAKLYTEMNFIGFNEKKMLERFDAFMQQGNKVPFRSMIHILKKKFKHSPLDVTKYVFYVFHEMPQMQQIIKSSKKASIIQLRTKEAANLILEMTEEGRYIVEWLKEAARNNSPILFRLLLLRIGRNIPLDLFKLAYTNLAIDVIELILNDNRFHLPSAHVKEAIHISRETNRIDILQLFRNSQKFSKLKL